MNVSLSGKLVLVTGGTGGLGRAVSLAFLAEGARVAVTYRNPAEFTQLQQDAGSFAGSLTGHAVDVTNESAVRDLIASLTANHTSLDVFVNTIGGYAGGETVWQQDASTLERMFTLNFRASATMLRAAVQPMLAQKSGAIITVSSKAALDHGPRSSAYSASKAAELAFVGSLAGELNGTGVRVNSIVPSIIDTDANRKAMPDADFSTWPKPEELARVILFLASDQASAIHGAAIPVYGAR
ncbi:MAG: SDR family NAD(P)-dependent oxidoreductase [Acidobacteriota bacterium]|nr:SDR family NAD(P)-dependent oxidoreductase [Acidobacteriota bacterium]